MEAAVSDADWNPHWLAFARGLGRDPGELVGEFNVEFMYWITGRLNEFRTETGAGERLTDAELADFGAYLFRWADEHGPDGQLALFEEVA